MVYFKIIVEVGLCSEWYLFLSRKKGIKEKYKRKEQVQRALQVM